MSQHTYRELSLGSLVPRIGRFVRTKTQENELASLALAIYGSFLAGRPFQDAIRTLLDVCYSIDQVKARTIGIKAPTAKSNDLQTAVGRLLAQNSRPSLEEQRWFDEFLELMRQGDGRFDGWGFAKLHIFSNILRYIVQTRSVAESASLLAIGSNDQIDVELASLEGALQDMMGELAELRRYGIKASYFEDSAMHAPGNAWVFWDSRDVESTFTSPRSFRDKIAYVGLAPTSTLTDLRLKSHDIDVGAGQVSGVALFGEGHFIWTMSNSAELDIFHALPGQKSTVRQIFEQAGKGHHYQFLRLLLATRLYDLIVPLEIVGKLPRQQEARNRLVQALGKNPKFTPIRDMLLPRVKELERRNDIREALERELEAADEDTAKRALHRHEVVAHIRRLPKGHHPSAKARQAALDAFGIVLADNETFVRKHGRGNLEPSITGHRHKMRPVEAVR